MDYTTIGESSLNLSGSLTCHFDSSICSVGDEALIAIGQGCPLQYLNLRGSSQISDAGIIAVARGCPELNHLDVSLLEVSLFLGLF